MSSNILITGHPGCGKTTLIKSLIAGFGFQPAGFYTEEIRGCHGREGFKIVFSGGRSGILAHINQTSSFRVGKYGVDIGQFDLLIEEERLNILKSPLVIIDEIGKMEFFSTNFKNLIMEILDSEQMLIATILLRPHPFADTIKGRRDVILHELKRDNFASLKNQIENHVKSKALY